MADVRMATLELVRKPTHRRSVIEGVGSNGGIYAMYTALASVIDGSGPPVELDADERVVAAPVVSQVASAGTIGRVVTERSQSMQLTPREQEKLLIFVAADVARRRRARGLRLNLPEATALITEAMVEGARDGRSVPEVMALARTVLNRAEVMDQVPELLHSVQVEATFPDGTKLVTCHDPIP